MLLGQEPHYKSVASSIITRVRRPEDVISTKFTSYLENTDLAHPVLKLVAPKARDSVIAPQTIDRYTIQWYRGIVKSGTASTREKV